jgi:hypothetical protein
MRALSQKQHFLWSAAALRLSQNPQWSGLSALVSYCNSFPGALPQAGIDRTFGALKHDFKAVKAP